MVPATVAGITDRAIAVVTIEVIITVAIIQDVMGIVTADGNNQGNPHHILLEADRIVGLFFYIFFVRRSGIFYHFIPQLKKWIFYQQIKQGSAYNR